MDEIEKALDDFAPNPKCELVFNSVFELLVAVVLSAQCTDKRVNQVTEKLFQKYSSPKAFANLTINELSKEIYSLGFYNTKAEKIISLSKSIMQNFNGEVPKTMEELTTLSGVGRKTASVVLSEGFKKPAFAVDTHVFRVANRLGIASTKNVEACEIALKKYFPKHKWSKIHLQMVLFGRYFCKAKNPCCSACKLKNKCVYFQKKEKLCS